MYGVRALSLTSIFSLSWFGHLDADRAPVDINAVHAVVGFGCVRMGGCVCVCTCVVGATLCVMEKGISETLKV